jgi:hypothetical protein
VPTTVPAGQEPGRVHRCRLHQHASPYLARVLQQLRLAHMHHNPGSACCLVVLSAGGAGAAVSSMVVWIVERMWPPQVLQDRSRVGLPCDIHVTRVIPPGSCHAATVVGTFVPQSRQCLLSSRAFCWWCWCCCVFNGDVDCGERVPITGPAGQELGRVNGCHR